MKSQKHIQHEHVKKNTNSKLTNQIKGTQHCYKDRVHEERLIEICKKAITFDRLNIIWQTIANSET